MSDDGYTLAETLAALAMIGLAISGLSLAMQTMGRQQARTSETLAQTHARRGANVYLQRLMDDQGAFRSHEPDRLSGDAQGFTFACHGAERCKVEIGQDAKGLALAVSEGSDTHRLSLRRSGSARFVYRGRLDESQAWPPERPERQALRSIALLQMRNGQEVEVLETRIWSEQPAVCAFDTVMQDCR